MEKINYQTYDSFEGDFWYILSRQDLLEKIFSKFLKRGKKKLKILDLGAGTGFNYDAASKFGEVHCLDFEKAAIKSCKKKGIKHTYLGDAHNLDMFKDSTFDVVMAIELIEHLDDDSKALSEVKRVLKKGGYFIGTTPAHKHLWSVDDDLAHHKRRYSKKNLKSKLSKFFKIEFLSYRYFFFYLPSLVLFNIQKLLKRVSKKEKNSLSFTPGLLNKVLLKIMNFENTLLSKRVKLFLGVGFVFVCKKK
ncbi:MAG: class I SAM-dependent methyltransferase [Nanoarchaeota archaeon]|nr:class I SAM-dependent methyltransferase [Nanoarchaeota archaeon]